MPAVVLGCEYMVYDHEEVIESPAPSFALVVAIDCVYMTYDHEEAIESPVPSLADVVVGVVDCKYMENDHEKVVQSPVTSPAVVVDCNYIVNGCEFGESAPTIVQKSIADGEEVYEAPASLDSLDGADKSDSG